MKLASLILLASLLDNWMHKNRNSINFSPKIRENNWGETEWTTLINEIFTSGAREFQLSQPLLYIVARHLAVSLIFRRFRGSVSIFSRLEITRVNYREFLDIWTTDVATIFWANASAVWIKDNIAKILSVRCKSRA